MLTVRSQFCNGGRNIQISFITTLSKYPSLISSGRYKYRSVRGTRYLK